MNRWKGGIYMLSIILWVVFGAIVGFAADYIDKGVVLSWPERIVVGVVGALVGGSIAQLITTGTIGIASAASFDIVSIIISIIGALIALFVWKRIRGTSAAV
jgi:uncharacterized membrane protein YeaQ/YmgE (transglycosylase-associated protein family)